MSVCNTAGQTDHGAGSSPTLTLLYQFCCVCYHFRKRPKSSSELQHIYFSRSPWDGGSLEANG